MNEKENIESHTILITDRNKLTLTGVLKIDYFDEEEFLFETVLGHLSLKGNMLELILLDTKEGKVVIHGEFMKVEYLDSVKKKEKQTSIFEKLFQWL